MQMQMQMKARVPAGVARHPASISAAPPLPAAAAAAAAAAARLLPAPGRRSPCAASYSGAASAPAPTVSLRLGSSADAATLSMPLPLPAARRLEAELRSLHATLRAKQEAADAGERPRRWPAMEFSFPSSPEDYDDAGSSAAASSLTMQLYCNPNAYGSAFDAKVLVRVECAAGGGGGGGGGAGGGAANSSPPVRMTGEARLTDLQGTLEVYWEEQQHQQGGEKK